MARNYINGDEVRITKTGVNTVDVEYYDGTVVKELEPRRLFPISGLENYITLLDSDGKEHAIIRSLKNLIPESREAIELCLREYYMIPKITAVTDRFEKYGLLHWTVETDRGSRSLVIRNRHSDLKMLYDGRILVRDSDDNRYEIPDLTKLDRKSLQLLRMDL